MAGAKPLLDSKRNAAQILDSFDWLSQTEGASAVVDATGAEVCTQTALLVTRKNGIFLQAGKPSILPSNKYVLIVATGMGPNEIVLPIATICARELTVLGSFRYNEGCYEQAISLVNSGLVDVKGIISHRYEFEDAVKAFET